MEVCILFLDPDAPRYTRPLQCSLYDRPVNCLSCKRDRAAVQKALAREKMVRYYGYYSNVCRGKRKASGEDDLNQDPGFPIEWSA